MIFYLHLSGTEVLIRWRYTGTSGTLYYKDLVQKI